MTPMRTFLTTVALTASIAAAQAQPAAPAGTGTDQNVPHPDGTPGTPPAASPDSGPVGPGGWPMMGYMMGDPSSGAAGRGPGGRPMAGYMMGGGAGWTMPMMPGAMMPSYGSMGMLPFNHVEGWIAFYKAELGITAVQSPQWDVFADAVRSSAKGMRSTMNAVLRTGAPATLPARADAMVEMMTAHLATMKAMLTATKQLYAVLSEDQKKKADELMAARPMGMRPWGVEEP